MKDIQTNWQQQALKEFELRKQAEQRAHAAIKTASETQELLKKTAAFKNYLESKYFDLDAMHCELSNKLQTTVSMLKKAKLLILQRKEDLRLLREENNKLKRALAAKTQLLNTEMQQNEELNEKIAKHLNFTALTACEIMPDAKRNDSAI